MGAYIPNMEKPKSCWECFNADCDHWGEHGYDNTADCPLTQIDLVRCGECRHSQSYTMNSELPISLWCCRFYKPMAVEPTDFCSYGERRADE